jgi:hypothetical protein
MKYNLTHRGVVIATFDSSELGVDELSELKRLKGNFFKCERAVPDTLPPLPDSYEMLKTVEQERARWGSRGHFRTGVNNYAQLPH